MTNGSSMRSALGRLGVILVLGMLLAGLPVSAQAAGADGTAPAVSAQAAGADEAPVDGSAAGTNEVAATADSLDFSDLDTYITELESYLADNLDGFSLRTLWERAKQGELDFSLDTLCDIIIGVCGKEIASGLVVMAELLVLAMLSMLLANMQSSFGGGVSAFSQGIVYLVLISIALQVFVLAGDNVKQAVELMSGFLYAVMPLLLTLLAAMGGVTAVGLFHPVLVIAVSMALNLINAVVLPLTYFCGALTVAGYVNPGLSLGKLTKLMRDIALGVLSITLTLFVAVSGLIGMAGASIDGLGVRAVKSASGLFIPIVGKSVADLLDTLVGTSLILKNCIGVVGIIIVILICISPAVKALVFSLIFRLGGACAEALGNEQLAAAMTGLGKVLVMFFAVVAAAGIFFFFLLAIIMSMGNLTMALR